MTFIKDSNVTLMVGDMARAIKFYTEVLELKLKVQYGDHWAELEAPGITIALHPSKKVEAGNSPSIAFRVDDIEKTIADMKAKGLECQLHDDEQVKLAFFQDPDGNWLYFSQPQY